MRFSTLLLAEHVTVTNGLINVLNGGARRLGRPVFPAALNMFLVGIVELPQDYTDGQQVKVEFSVTSFDESVVLGGSEGTFQTETLPEADRRVLTTPLIVDLRGVPLPKPGLYKINATVAESNTESLHFEVVTVDLGAGVPTSTTVVAQT